MNEDTLHLHDSGINFITIWPKGIHETGPSWLIISYLCAEKHKHAKFMIPTPSDQDELEHTHCARHRL